MLKNPSDILSAAKNIMFHEIRKLILAINIIDLDQLRGITLFDVTFLIQEHASIQLQK